MIRSAIVDDERRSRETLTTLLGRFCPQVDIVASADSIASGASAIRSLHPELLFLDIQMPNGTAFDLLDQVRDVPCEVIFTTAYDQYAIRAIRACALDYLLKPIGEEELIVAVQRAEKQLSGRRSQGLDTLLQNITERNSIPTKIALPTLEDLIFIQIADIVRCEASGNYTLFHLINGESHIVSKTLKEYEAILCDAAFFRVHHAHLVNLNRVRKYIRGEGGTVVMADGAAVQVARRRKEELLERLSRL